MGKTNFTKVEEALVAGLQQMTVAQLIEMADTANIKTPPTSAETTKLLTIQKTLLLALQLNINRLGKKDPDVYQKIGITKKKFKKFVQFPSELSSEDWKLIKETQDKLDLYMEEFIKNSPLCTNEQIIEQERVKHINKRFNVNEKWLPLQ